MDSSLTRIEFHIGEFDGPLDLLLHLISVNRVDIMDIPIALILEQYMQALAIILDRELENACEFVAMAAQLVLIKTKMLLPRPQTDQEDPRSELVKALLEYKLVKQSAPFFAKRIQAGRDCYMRPPAMLFPVRISDYRQSPSDLRRAAKNIALRESRKILPQTGTFQPLLSADPVSVEEKMADIISHLETDGSLKLKRLYSFARSRSELVAIFLALLELIAQHRADLDDENTTVYSAGE